MATRLTPRKPEGEKSVVETGSPEGESAAPGPDLRSRKTTSVSPETAQVLRDAEAGKNLLHYPSLEIMFEDLGI